MTRYMRQRLKADERDPSWAHWVMGCMAGMCYLVLISWLG